MAANNAKTDSKKTMDVSAPGKQTPDTSARPIIVGHKPMIKDPMVKPEDTQEVVATEEPAVEPIIHMTKTIEPPKEIEVSEQAQPSTSDGVSGAEEAAPSAEVTEEITPPTETLPQEEEAPAEEAEQPADEPVESNESAEVDAIAEQVDAGKKDKAPDEEEKKRKEQIQKLVTEKKYFVPIGQVTRRRKNRQAIIVLVLLIVLAGAGFYAYQKGYIKLPS